MYRRILAFLGLTLLVVTLAGCHNKKVNNPLANVGSKQPDKVLFDRAMDQMKHNHMDQARIILQTLINTYPDSEYIARAKLAVGDSWYAEGGSAALAQAENEYKDFETFFPNMPEAAEAQLKIANIHYRQMEKPDRDFTHAMRAEEEYRNLIQQYPDSKLVAEAKDRLREVQEALAEREFRIGRFYFLRESWAAAIARLQSVVDDYPLYSGADEALYLLGGAYERQIDAIRASKFDEVAKGKMIKDFSDKAAAAYARIVTRYPATDRAGDARKRLEALHRPVPTPTPEAIAQNKREEESRRELGRFGKLKLNLHRGPDTSLAARVGEPTLVDPKPTNAPDIVRANTAAIMAASAKTGGGETGTGSVSVETVKSGAPPPNQPVPRSDAQPGTAPAADTAPVLRPIPSADSSSAGPDTGTASSAAGSSNKGQSPAPPAQVNEAAGDQGNAAASSANASSSSSSDKNTTSSSKKKKKKGLGRLIPF
ncbi:MAG: outer membrane protein assembly factor BamD [Acidobacteriia bacterium]|nr:outer membrane protein assembly factor BamD [Terriglobia bacterium]